MFGVSRCSCGSVITEDDLTCIGCQRVLNRAVRPPLKCDLCGELPGTTPNCERCHPELVQRDVDIVIPSPSRPPLHDEELPFWRLHPVLIGALCCAVSVLGGYFWGRSDQRDRDDFIYKTTQHNLQQQADREREALEQKLAEALAPKLEPFVGPLRIGWGQSPESSTIQAVNSLHVVTESKDVGGGALEQQYTGTFGGTPNAGIAVRYCHQKLSSVIVSLPASSEPVYRVWRDLLETSRITYGEPSSLVRPASAQAFENELVAALEPGDGGPRKAAPDERIEQVEDEVKAGKNALYAEWEFPQNVAMRLSGTVASQGAIDERTVLQWAFVKADLETPCAPPDAPSRDH